MKNILYITYDGLTDPLGQSQVLPYLTGLSSAGYSITVLSCEKKKRFLQNKEEVERICRENNIDWQYIPFSTRPPLLAKAWDLYKLKTKAYSLYREKKFGWVHCRSYIASTVGLRMKKKFNTGFIFDMRDFWIDEKIDDGSWNLKNPLYQFIYRRYRGLEKKFFNHSDAVVCLTNAAREEIIRRKYVGDQEEKIFVIPCCADLSLFKPASLSYPENKTICYLGSIGNGKRYLLKEMLQFYKMAVTQIPGLKFLILSQDPKDTIQKVIDKEGLGAANITTMSVKRAELPTVLAQVNYGIFFYKPSFVRKSTSPVKLGEMLAMGIPVVCNTGVGDVDPILSSTGAGITITDFTRDEYSAAFKKLSASKHDKNQIRGVAEEYFSLEKGIEQYKRIYKKLSALY